MSIDLEKNCIRELLKEEEKRNLEPIYKYLLTLKNFTYILKNFSSSNYENILNELSKKLKLKKICKNEVIFQQGEKGENFYIVLNGHLKILILRPYEYYMTEEEYILYLLNSRINNQMDIINQCNHFNSLIYPIPYDNFDVLIKDLVNKETKAGLYLDSQKIIKKAIEVNEIISKESNPELNNQNNHKKIIISPEDYIKMNKVSEHILYNTIIINNFINNNNVEENNEEDTKKIKLMMKDRKKVIIPDYEIFTEIETGASFGEFSLEGQGGRQECSVICVQDESHLAYINKKEYLSLIHQSIDKRSSNIFNIIIYFSLYRPINQVLFEKKYLHFFRNKVFDINSLIFNEGDEWGEMYFITDGEYELSVNKNIIEVNELIIKYKEILQKLNKNNKLNNNYLNSNEEIKQNSSLILNQKFNTNAANKLIFDKKYIKLNILYAKDIIGLSDVFLYNNENENYNKENNKNNYNKPTVIYGEQVKKKCLVSCKCLTYNCHTYCLNNNIFNNLYYNEGNYNQSSKHLEIKKICSIIQRLQSHKDYIFELVNKEQNKFSKKLKKLKFFTKNPKIHKKGKLDPNVYHNILTEIKTSSEQKDIVKKLYKKNSLIGNIFNKHNKDKYIFNKQFFPSIYKNKKPNIFNKYSINLKLMKKKQNNEKEKNETIYTLYNKNSNNSAQDNLAKILIRDFIYEKYFYNYTFNDLKNINLNEQNNYSNDKSLNEQLSNKYFNNIKTEDNTQNNFIKSFSYDKTKRVINIKSKNINDEINKNNSLCKTNLEFYDNNPEILKSNFSIDGRIFEKKSEDKIISTNNVTKIGRSKIRLTKIKENKIYDPLSFDKFNNFFNINFRNQYLMSDISN